MEYFKNPIHEIVVKTNQLLHRRKDDPLECRDCLQFNAYMSIVNMVLAGQEMCAYALLMPQDQKDEIIQVVRDLEKISHATDMNRFGDYFSGFTRLTDEEISKKVESECRPRCFEGHKDKYLLLDKEQRDEAMERARVLNGLVSIPKEQLKCLTIVIAPKARTPEEAAAIQRDFFRKLQDPNSEYNQPAFESDQLRDGPKVYRA